MSESGDSSRQSFSTGGESSAASETSDAQALNALQDRAGADDENINDLISGNRGVSEAIFATLVLLGKNRNQQDLRWVVLRIVLEFLQMFRVVFNTEFAWMVHKENWAFKAIYWVLFRFLVLPKGYNTYIVVFYIVAATTFVSLALAAYVAVVLKKDDSTAGGWLSRLVQFMQLLAMIMYSVAWVSILDFLVFMFSCHWERVASISAVTHTYFGKECMAMPHLAHMAFALVVTLVFMCTCLGLSVGDCDLNPLTRNVLATPAAVTNLINLTLKMLMVILSTAGSANPKLQCIVMTICSGYITYQMMMAAAYYADWVNHAWNGLWTGIVYTCILLVVVTFRAANNPVMAELLTWAVLYGIFGAVILGGAVSALRLYWLRQPLVALKAARDDPEAQRNLRNVMRFKDTTQVEILARVMRKWDDDGQPDEDACAFGEFIYKCGMARFPNDPTLMITLANFYIEAHKDGQAARTQLQLAVKANPSLIQRFFIYKTQDLAKKLKESGGLDLMGYIEFQRNYRACVRAHRMALQAQRVFWQVLLHDTVAFKSLQSAFIVMNGAEKQATQIYRRVLERYPANGRLLKIYGRFLEWVRNEPSVAQKYYVEAMKQGMGESLLALIGGSASGMDQEGVLKVLGSVDEKSDAIVITNASGIIMAVNRAAFEMFEYQKGELESKNVSCLMPQPFSGRHNSYMSHYTQTGDAQILNVTKQLVAITKNHTIFPISLTVVKLSGTGQDCIFMGLIRAVDQRDPSRVRLWVAPVTGTILCADERFADNFGITHQEVAGRAFSTLGPDIEALERLIEEATAMPVEERQHKQPTLECKLLHRFLPPVDVRVVVEFGGTSSESIFIINIEALNVSGAMMVVDHKGRIVYATSQLGAMLGYTARQLAAMELQNVVPPPYSQMHAGFMKELGNKPPTTSCRAGAVVHLLRSNGVKVPVTLALSTHDDGERLQHVVRVTQSSDEVQLDHQRLVLKLDQEGRVTGVNSGATKALFGFSPQELIGKPVRGCVNVFGDWAKKFGEEGSLLTALGVRALEGADESWRVGVVLPGRDGAEGAGGESSSGGASLLAALQQRNRIRPALMQAEVVMRSDTDDSAAGGQGAGDAVSGAAGDEATLQLVLWRSDAVTAVVELDKNLAIVRADPAAGLLFGLSSKMMIKKDFRRLAGLPKTTAATDLLTAAPGARAGHGKKSGLKAGAAPRVGVRKTLHTTHADGAPLDLEMQAVLKQTRGSQHLVLRLQLAEPSTGSVEPLLALRGGAAAAVSRILARADSTEEESGVEEGPHGDEPGGGSPHGGDREGPSGAGARSGKAAAHVPRRGAALDAEEDGPSHGGGDEEEEGSDGEEGGRGRGRGRGSMEDPKRRVAQWVKQTDSFKHGGEGEVEAGGEEGGRDRDRGRRSAAFAVPAPASASEGGGSSAGGAPGGAPVSAGELSASQASGSEGGDATSASGAGEGHGDEELNVDFRRAKRLKKLNRMMTSSGAQSATLRFKQQTWLVILIILGAHVMGYAVLSTEIEKRFKNMHDTAIMARATDRFQLSAMRINFAQKCSLPDFAVFDACSATQIQNTLDRLKKNLDLVHAWHQILYLGESRLVAFPDPRLYNFWTKTPLDEEVWLQESLDGPPTIEHRNATIWDMGNKFVAAGRDVHYLAPSLGAALENLTQFQYMALNGPNSIFHGYSWSLDTQVDYSWLQLGSLNTVLIVLLIVEALCVQIACMSYQFFLVRSVNAQHMKRFSVFLALPSATIRIMASRHMVVDDDGAEDADEDEDLEVMQVARHDTTAATKEGEATTTGDKDKPKSVRMATGPGDEEEEEEEGGDRKGRGKGGRSGTRRKASTAGAHEAAAEHKKPKPLGTRIYKALFGWIDTIIKVNGKKLTPNSLVVIKFMVPLLAWAAVVIVIFGVTFQKLAGLQAPLASLNAAARVTYRISRVRLAGNYMAFSLNSTQRLEHKALLLDEISTLRHEYTALMYGGELAPVANVTYDSTTPAAAFANEAFANLFFRTKECLREDKSACFPPGHKWYDVTHSGLDTLVERFVDSYEAFALLPESLALANHPLYSWINSVGGHDMVEGIYRAVDLFEEYTIGQFQAVTQLHQIMLVVTIFLVLGFMALLYRPYVKLLHEESKDIAGMLSQLPAEVNVEDTVKSQVLGIVRPPGGAGSMAGSASMMVMGAPGAMPGGGGFPMGAMMQGPGGRMMGMPGPQGMAPGGFYGGGGGYGGGPGGPYGGADGAVAVNIGGRGGFY